MSKPSAYEPIGDGAIAERPASGAWKLHAIDAGDSSGRAGLSDK
jgi:hypothetical protein